VNLVFSTVTVQCPLHDIMDPFEKGLQVDRTGVNLSFYVLTCGHHVEGSEYEMVLPGGSYVAFMERNTDGAPRADQDDAGVPRRGRHGTAERKATRSQR
jgi:hypothetical protein